MTINQNLVQYIRTTVNLIGAGKAEVYANLLLNVTITGSGSLVDAN